MRRQLAALVGLTLIHFCADLFGGLVPAVLPVIRGEFGLSLTAGVALITVLSFSANGVQLLAGHYQGHRREPVFLKFGLVLAATIALIPFVPRGPWAVVALAGCMLVGGAGIAVIHPEGLRGIHLLDRIPSSVTTAFFLVGGYGGFAGGAFVSTLLVERWGLKGLSALLVCPLIGIAVVRGLRIHLAVEAEEGDRSEAARGVPRVAFGHLLAMAVPMATSSTIIPSLLPTYLYEQGMPLSFCGTSSMLFGAGGAAGGVVWGLLAHRMGYLPCLILSLLMGVPLLAVYMGSGGQGGSMALLLAAGFCVYASYPLVVTMARYGLGLRLSQRMALIVGGVWGIAGTVFLAMGPVAERVGVGPVLKSAWIGYFVTAVYGIWLLRRLRRVCPA